MALVNEPEPSIPVERFGEGDYSDFYTSPETKTVGVEVKTDSNETAVVAPNRWITSREGRLWVYGVAVAALGALTVYGVVTVEQAVALSGVFAAVASVAVPAVGTVATALAAANLPKKD